MNGCSPALSGTQRLRGLRKGGLRMYRSKMLRGMPMAAIALASLSIAPTIASGSTTDGRVLGTSVGSAIDKSFVLTPTGFGSISDFTKTTAAAVSNYLGRPTRRATANCSAQGFGRVPVVEWGDFALVGRDHHYIDYIYTPSGVVPYTRLPKHVHVGSIHPRLTTIYGISLGTTVAKLKIVSPDLDLGTMALGNLYQGVVDTPFNQSDPMGLSIDVITTSGAPTGQVVAISVADAEAAAFCPLG